MEVRFFRFGLLRRQFMRALMAVDNTVVYKGRRLRVVEAMQKAHSHWTAFTIYEEHPEGQWRALA